MSVVTYQQYNPNELLTKQLITVNGRYAEDCNWRYNIYFKPIQTSKGVFKLEFLHIVDIVPSLDRYSKTIFKEYHSCLWRVYLLKKFSNDLRCPILVDELYNYKTGHPIIGKIDQVFRTRLS
jgi:hypothetical protein